jgi:hypothetical protein
MSGLVYFVGCKNMKKVDREAVLIARRPTPRCLIGRSELQDQLISPATTNSAFGIKRTIRDKTAYLLINFYNSDDKVKNNSSDLAKPRNPLLSFI